MVCIKAKAKTLCSSLLAALLLLCVFPYPACAANVEQEAYNAYLDLLNENREAIAWYEQFIEGYSDGRTPYRSIAIQDVTGDGLPELILDIPEKYGPGVTWISETEIQVWTYRNGQLLQILRETHYFGAVTGATVLFQIQNDPSLYFSYGLGVTLYEGMNYRKMEPDSASGMLRETHRWEYRGSYVPDGSGSFEYELLQIDGRDSTEEEYRQAVNGILRNRTQVLYNTDWDDELLSDRIADGNRNDWYKLKNVSMTYREAVAQLEKLAAQENSGGQIELLVNGKAVVWTDATPFVDANQRTMVPLRAVGEALNLTVSWDAAARSANFSNGKKSIFFPIDSPCAATSDGQSIPMDTAAVIMYGRTFAPVRYLAEYFGYTVTWDGVHKTVILNQ